MIAPDISRNWNCSACGEVVDAGFEQCWNCGCLYDGSPDPDVAREAVIEKAEHWENVRCECGFVGPGYVIDSPNNLLADLVGFLMGQMAGVGFTTKTKIRCCPQCHSSSCLLPTDENPNEEATKVSKQAQAAYYAKTQIPLSMALLLALGAVGYAIWIWIIVK